MQSVRLAVLALGWAWTSAVLSQEFEIVPLPKVKVEFRMHTGGKIAKQETKEFVGVFNLPFHSNPDWRPEGPPFGHREQTTTERLTVLGRTMDVKRLDWILKDSGEVANFNAETITFWVSEQIDAPEFSFPMKNGPSIPLPAGTVRFEHVPRKKASAGDPDGKRKVLVTGKLVAKKESSLASKTVSAYVYEVTSKSADETVNAEFWLSRQVPGGVFKATVEMAGRKAATVVVQVKEVGSETLSDELRIIARGEFAVEIPKGWVQTRTQGSTEVLRLVPQAVDAKLDRAIIVTMTPAAGKRARNWAHEKYGSDDYGLSFASNVGLADRPTFTAHRWRAGAGRVQTSAMGGINRDRLYIISHWQNGVGEREYAGSKEVGEIVRSWRWLRPK